MIGKAQASRPAPEIRLNPLSRSAVMSVPASLYPKSRMGRSGICPIASSWHRSPACALGRWITWPTALQAEYYGPTGFGRTDRRGKRPRSVLRAFGYADTPGLWSADQVRGWRLVTDAVHGRRRPASSRSFGTPVLLPIPTCAGGSQPLSASDVDLLHESVTPSGRKPTVCSPTDDHRRKSARDRCRLLRARSTQRNGGWIRRIGDNLPPIST